MNEPKTGVYQIRNLLNGKIYIGSAKNLIRREHEHWSSLKKQCHRNSHLQNAYNFYGEENFVFEVLANTNVDNLVKVEDMLIKLFKANNRDYGYNIRKNAENNLGLKHSESTKQKLSISSSGESNGHYGKPQSEESRKRISDAKTGKKQTEAARISNSISHSGSKNPADKLNEEQVLEIRKMIYEGIHYLIIMKTFNLSQTNFYRIKNNIIWKNVIYNPV
jgi:group I intron endonuclease